MAAATNKSQDLGGSAKPITNSQSVSGHHNLTLQGLNAGHDITIYARGDERKRIEEWLSRLQLHKLRNQLRQKRVHVGDWLLDSAEFVDWNRGQNSIVVDLLEKERENFETKEARVFYLCLDVEPDDRPDDFEPVMITKELLIGDLLKQLFQKCDANLPAVCDMYAAKKRRSAPLEWREACQIWRNEIKEYDRVYLIVDALDRCDETVASDMLNELCLKCPNNLSLKSNTERLFQEFPEQIQAFYRDAIKKITDQTHPTDRELGLKVIYFVSNTKRDLTMIELRHILAIKPGSSDLNQDDLCQAKKLRSVAANLISVNDIEDENSIVQLFNDTVKSFLLEFDITEEYAKIRREDSSPMDLTFLCLTYLHYRSFATPCENFEALEKRLEDYPLAEDAAHFWGEHLRDWLTESSPSDSSQNLAMAEAILLNKTRLASWTQVAWYRNQFQNGGLDVRNDLSGLHLCAWFGITSMIPKLSGPAHKGIDVREKTYGQTPLMYACRNGHAETARKLLDCGADINLSSARGRSPIIEVIDPQLHTLSTAGNFVLSSSTAMTADDDAHLETLRVLLDRDEVQVNSTIPRYFNCTPLMLAVQLSKSGVVEALLAHPDVDINFQDSCGRTALSSAPLLEFTEIVQMLVDHPQIDVNICDNSMRQTPLMNAAEVGNAPAVKILLAKGANTALKDTQGGNTASLRAATFGHLSVTEILLQHPEKEHLVSHEINDDGQGLLHVAAGTGQISIVRLLTSYNLDVNAQDRYGMTPLHHACRSGSSPIINMLIYELAADYKMKDAVDRTPLLVAYQYNHKDAEELLRSLAVERNDGSRYALEDALPLWALARRGDTHAIEDVIGSETAGLADPEPGSGNTALHWAVRNGDDEMLEYLLKNGGISVNSTNSLGRTPLHDAALLGQEELILRLLDNKAAVDPKDQRGFTPLIVALASKKLSAAVTLFENGADVDLIPHVREVKVQTLFFAAVTAGNAKAAKALLDKGADILGRNPEGQTAPELGTGRQASKELLRMLRSTKSFSTYPDDQKDSPKNRIDVDAEPINSQYPSEMARVTWYSGTALWQSLKGLGFQDRSSSSYTTDPNQPIKEVEMYRCLGI
ncbi:MAG: hypothetical protein Q9165_001256 [Trypethelium subeluteriae]